MHRKIAVLIVAILAVSHEALAVNNAPADAQVVNLRTSCTQNGGSTEVPNCFNSMAALDTWLRNVRQAGPTNPTLVEIGPGNFGSWFCGSSHVTLRGSGRDRTVILGTPGSFQALSIDSGCTNLNVQDLTVDGHLLPWGVSVFNLEAVTSWTNVEVFGGLYGWIESVPASCQNHNGRHTWFSSRITSTGVSSSGFIVSRAYTASCATSWFWGSELTSRVNGNESNAFALEAHNAEIHLYGSTVRLLLASNTTASSFTPVTGGHYLVAALAGSDVHIHGTGLDIIHSGSGTVDMLYADLSSHFHANESAANIHVTGPGRVRRVAGAGRIEAPYTWGADTRPPLSSTSSGVQTLSSRNGADNYIETDCPLSGPCSAGGDYPHLMVYRAQCTGSGADQGPWFDTVTRDCRQ